MDRAAQHFLTMFDQGPPDECWPWKGSIASNGYGRFGDKATSAHRFSLQHFKGPIPDGMEACHMCDNRSCVNPNHLYAGTREQNMRDKHDRGRHWPFALNVDDVKAIRARMAQGLRYGDLKSMAEEYGCHISLLHLIKNNKIWPNVPWPEGFTGDVPKLKATR